MFKSKGIYILAGLLLLLNLVLLSFFWYTQGRKPPPPDHHRKAGVGEQIRDALNLDKGQFEALEESRSVLEQEFMANRDNIKDTRHKIHRAFTQNPPDTVLSQKLSAQLGAYYEQEENFLFKHYLEVYNLCDENQKQLLPKVFLNTIGSENKKGNKGPKDGKHAPPHH